MIVFIAVCGYNGGRQPTRTAGVTTVGRSP